MKPSIVICTQDTVACNTVFSPWCWVRPKEMQGQVSCLTLEDCIAYSRWMMYCMAGLSWTLPGPIHIHTKSANSDGCKVKVHTRMKHTWSHGQIPYQLLSLHRSTQSSKLYPYIASM